jgi:hypothetical protein
MKTKLFLAKESQWVYTSPREFGSRVESELNEWLEAHPNIKIVEIVQSFSSGWFFQPMTLFISLWYEDSPHQP